MTDIENFNKNQLELLKKLKSVGSDLWGAIADQGGAPDAGDSAAPAASEPAMMKSYTCWPLVIPAACSTMMSG